MEEYCEGKIHPVENFYAMQEIGLIYGISNNHLYTHFERREELFQNPFPAIFDTKLTVLENLSSYNGRFKDTTIKTVARKIELE
jgi:hypothetical protein